jgi:hypothetical protein
MDFHLLLRNRHVSRVLVGVPDGHQHIRARIETAGGDVITLQEATLAAIARAYLTISTHPTRNAVELRATRVPDRKDGFAEFQLIETDSEEQLLRAELAAPPPEPPSDLEPLTEPATLPMRPDSRPILPPRPGDLSDVLPDAPDATPTPPPKGPPTNPGASLEDLDLDDPVEEDDGPIFGDVPTMHSLPSGEESS